MKRTKPVGRGHSRGKRGGPPGGAPRGRGKPQINVRRHISAIGII
jgi:hypothetical protein